MRKTRLPRFHESEVEGLNVWSQKEANAAVPGGFYASESMLNGIELKNALADYIANQNSENLRLLNDTDEG